MRATSKKVPAIALALCGVLLVGGLAEAQENRTRDRRRPNSRVGSLDSRISGKSFRASKLIGMDIENAKEENVGSVKDIVLDSQTGRIQYVAVTYGGFLGLGNKMFAVPFEAFQVQQDPDDPNDADDFVLVLNVTQKQLEGAQGFDEDHWPNFADRNFTNDLYKRYNVERRWNANRRDRDVNVNVGRDGIDVDVDRDND